MIPTEQVRLDRIKSCVCDLRENGICVADADDKGLKRLVRQHVDYFQAMLGYDSDVTEIISLLRTYRTM